MERLTKYDRSGSFYFYPLASKKDCFKESNAPTDASGIYLIYGLKKGKEELVYIGISGRMVKGVFRNRGDGIKGRLEKGIHSFSDGRRKTRYIFWKEQMIADGFENLRINWFVTHNGADYLDNPKVLETELTRLYQPRWDRVTK